MKTKLSYLILAFMFIAAALSASDYKGGDSADVYFAIGESWNFGYSTNEIKKATDVPEVTTEAFLVQSLDRKEVSLDEDLYVYWIINVKKATSLSLSLSISEDLTYDGYVLPMTVTVNGKSVSGCDVPLEVFRIGKEEAHGAHTYVDSSLIRISCPVSDETPAGTYEGKITLTLEYIG